MEWPQNIATLKISFDHVIMSFNSEHLAQLPETVFHLPECFLRDTTYTPCLHPTGAMSHTSVLRRTSWVTAKLSADHVPVSSNPSRAQWIAYQRKKTNKIKKKMFTCFIPVGPDIMSWI